MERLPTVDHDTATVVRQITAEIKSVKPITITSRNVDIALMNKLFGQKRGFVALPKSGDYDDAPNPYLQPCKRKRSDAEEGPIDKNLMNALFKENAKSDENLPSSCSPSPPLVITQPIRPQKRATISREAQNFNEDIARLQKEALEAQIAKDRVIALYYQKKLELLESLQPKKS